MTPRRKPDPLLQPAADSTQRLQQRKGELRKYLIHTRELLNGCDYLFSGPEPEIQAMLSDLVKFERRPVHDIQFNYVKVENYFLLRMMGSEKHQREIRAFFE